MRKLIIALLFAVGTQAQTTVPSLKIQNTPVVLNDTTAVDILVRQKTGSAANLGMVKRVNWSYLLSIFGGAGSTQNLASVLLAGNSAPYDIRLQDEHGLILEGSDPVTKNAYLQWVDGFTIHSTTEEFLFNDKNMVRSVGGVPANLEGDVPLGALADSLSGNFIPIGGTVTGQPVTGDIEFSFEGDPYINGSVGLNTLNDGLSIKNHNNTNSVTYNAFVARENDTSSDLRRAEFVFESGLGADVDYSESNPDNKLIYAQRQYVDDAIISNAIPLSGTVEDSPVTGNIEFEWGTDKSLITLSEDETQGGQILFGTQGVTLNGFNSDNNATLDINIDGNIVVTSTNRGMIGASDFTAIITDLDYTQKKYVDDAIAAVDTPSFNNVLQVNDTVNRAAAEDFFVLQSPNNVQRVYVSDEDLIINRLESLSGALTEWNIAGFYTKNTDGSAYSNLNYGSLNLNGVVYTYDRAANILFPSTDGTKYFALTSNSDGSVTGGSGTVTSVTGDTTGGINVATGTTTPAITASTASGTQRGTTKLYNNVSGTNTDGAPDQASVKTALDLKSNDNTVVHIAGSETVTGAKTFSATTLTADVNPINSNTSTLGTVSNYYASAGISMLNSTIVQARSSAGLFFRNTFGTTYGSMTNAGLWGFLSATVTNAPVNPTDVVRLSDLQAVGSGYVAKTAAYTLTAADHVVDLTTGTAIFTLPTAVGAAGKQYVVKNSGTGALTVNTTSTQTIDGALTKPFPAQYSGMRVVSDGANWKIIGLF